LVASMSEPDFGGAAAVHPEAVVLGNTAFDILCYPVEDVPRHGPLVFEKAAIAPGGCGSNTAIGLSASGVQTALITAIGDDIPGRLALEYWHEFKVDTGFVMVVTGGSTGVSVGLVDLSFSPRFVHTPGSNTQITLDNLPVSKLLEKPPRVFHIAGFFLMKSLLDSRLASFLAQLQGAGAFTSLDVAHSPRMANPAILWELLPHLDTFFCNEQEAQALIGITNPSDAADIFVRKGAKNVVIKTGKTGCWLQGAQFSGNIPSNEAQVADTTGAGDAFCAGFLAAIVRGEDTREACRQGNLAGARIVSSFGAVAAWR
jgi:sugar/nucleoside kinase (ribokinase family)